jgi:hypothetical protein
MGEYPNGNKEINPSIRVAAKKSKLRKTPVEVVACLFLYKALNYS